MESEIIDIPKNTTGIGCSTLKPDRWLPEVGSVGQRSDDCNCDKNEQVIYYLAICQVYY